MLLNKLTSNRFTDDRKKASENKHERKSRNKDPYTIGHRMKRFRNALIVIVFLPGSLHVAVPFAPVVKDAIPPVKNTVPLVKGAVPLVNGKDSGAADSQMADSHRGGAVFQADTVAPAALAGISVDATRILNKISPLLYGSCIEDVNHEIYGGLYGQRLFGESFEEPPRRPGQTDRSGAGSLSDSTASDKDHSGELYGVSGMWDGIRDGAAGSSLALDSSDAYTGRQSQVILHAGAPGRIGVANRGLNRWGIAVRKGQSFEGRLYLRWQELQSPSETESRKRLPGLKGPKGLKEPKDLIEPQGVVTVALQSSDGSRTYAMQRLPTPSPNWKKYSFRLTAAGTDAHSRFVVIAEAPGKLWMDQVALFPTGPDRFKGLLIRNDIAVKMQQEGLRFVRYGGSMVNAPGYRWKKMIGDRDRRPPYNGTWYPYSSNGFGIEDFLQFCEAAGFEAAFAINIEETDQDAADLIEYLKGSQATTWGKKRTDNGHPQPYKIQTIEIGNEEVIDSDDTRGYDHYIERFNGIYRAIHAKYPGIRLVNAAWWRSQSANMEHVFKALDGKAAYWDLHVDADSALSGLTVDQRLAKMQRLFLQWNPHTTMKCTIFEENGGLHNLQRALGHATILNAARRHGDFLLTSCAANGLQALGQNDNGWDQGQVFFTPDQVWGMPPFYAQQMAAGNHQPLRVLDSVTGPLDVTATRSEDGKTLVLHVVNVESRPVKTSLSLTGFPGCLPQAGAWTLAGDLPAENTPEEPQRVCARKSVVVLPRKPAGGIYGYTFPAHSYTILRFRR